MVIIIIIVVSPENQSPRYFYRKLILRENMVKKCSVPGCTSTSDLRSVPFTNKLTWKQWTSVCPHLRKYNLRQLEYVKICNRHFLPKHINEKGRLTKEAVPCFYLNSSKHNKKDKVLEGNIFLEISPILPNESVNFKVVGPASVSPQALITFNCSSSEGSLPVDHSMYCLPSRADMSAKELLTAKMAGTPVDHMYYGTPLPDNTAGCLPKGHKQHNTEYLSPRVEYDIKAEPIAAKTVTSFNAPVWCSILKKSLDVNVASQTDAATEHSVTQFSEQQPNSLAANIENSQKADLETRELLLDSQSVSLDNFDNSNMHDDNVYVVPTDKPVLKKNPDKSAIYLSPEDLLTSKSPLEKETLESIKVMFSSLKEQYNLPLNYISTKSSQVNKFSQAKNPTKISSPPPALKPISVMQPLQRKGTQAQTLESLVAALIESVSTEEGVEVHPSAEVTAVETVVNPTSDTSTCLPMQDPPGSNTEIRRVRLNKENCTPNEKMLRSHNNILKAKLRNLNKRYRKLKSKSDTIFAKAKEFIKNYPHLRPESKLMVDMQIRLARKHPRGARYSVEEKMFALKLLQTSPESYKFMQPLLKLPTKSTMKDFEKNA